MKQRVAYTLNDHQPVTCNLIGDQPLFYRDDDLFTLEESDMVRGCIDEMNQFFNDPEEDAIFPFYGEEVFNLNGLKARLELLDSTKDLLELVEITQDISVGTYEIDGRVIKFNPYLLLEDAFILTSHHMRIISQDYRDPLEFRPEDAVLYNRLINADADAFMCKVAWEANLLNWSYPVDRLLESCHRDLMGTLYSIAREDFRTLKSGEVLVEVIEHWFLSDRPTEIDRALIHDRMLPNNGYCTKRTDEEITTVDVLKVGETRDGNYFSPHINTLMNDPIFSEVRCNKLGNFIWYMKFERSHTEAEDELRQV